MKRIISLNIFLFMFLTSSMPILDENIAQQKIQNKELECISVQYFNEYEDVVKTEEISYELLIEEMQSKMSAIGNIENKKDWFITYKEIVDEYKEVLDPPLTIYDYFLEEELEMLFRVVQAEIGDEYTFEQKVNVASVIFNRLNHAKFGNTLFEILTSDQFCTVRNKRYENVDVSYTTILACEYAFEIEDTTNGCLFFDSNNALNYKFVFNDGAHNFYQLRE